MVPSDLYLSFLSWACSGKVGILYSFFLFFLICWSLGACGQESELFGPKPVADPVPDLSAIGRQSNQIGYDPIPPPAILLTALSRDDGTMERQVKGTEGGESAGAWTAPAPGTGSSGTLPGTGHPATNGDRDASPASAGAGVGLQRQK